MALILHGRIPAIVRSQDGPPPEDLFLTAIVTNVNLNRRLIALLRQPTPYPIRSAAYMTFVLSRAT
jgi:hypothetical protein